jgi:dUTP pyrophosphatase
LSQPTAACGQHFAIDFGFMKGGEFVLQDKEGRTITSIDGYRSYCIIVNRASRYTWVFLTKTKHPPVDLITKFLEQHDNKQVARRTICTDEGGELWNSALFRDAVYNQGYNLEPTAAGAPSQNGLAERPNQTFGNMVRCLLFSAALGPEFWSFALLHAVYLKNRLPHTALNDTPYKVYTGQRPSAKHLRVFGCPIIARQPGKRPTKLDNHTTTGRFLGYTATDKNIYYIDDQTRRIKITTYCTFDEAAMTLPAIEQPPSAKVLQQVGYAAPSEEDINLSDTDETTLQISLLSENATMPIKASNQSAGFDLFSPQALIIAPGQRALVPLDIAATPPPGTYLQIAPRSSLAAKHCVDTKAGVIDADFNGNITVVLHNSGEQPFSIQPGDCIAQLLVIHIATPSIVKRDTLQATQQGAQGFGSTGTAAIVRHTDAAEINESGTMLSNDAQIVELPYHITMSADPFDDTEEITIPIKGDHPTLGCNFMLVPIAIAYSLPIWL